MKAKSLNGISADEISNSLVEAITDGFTPTLAIVFLSIKQDHSSVTKMLDEKNIAVFGVTTNGEFIDGEPKQGSIAILLLEITPASFFIRFAELNGVDDVKTTKTFAEESLNIFKKPAFLIAASNLQTNPEALLQGITDTAGNKVNVFGAMAGDDMNLTEQFVFTKGKSSNRAIIMLILDEEKILIKGRATSGWKAVGTSKTVTKSEGSRVYSIDNMPALDICLKYGGLKVNDPNLAMELVINFPLQLQRENGEPVMRPSYKINWEDRSLTTSGEVPQGSKVRFSLPPDFDVIEKVIDGCKELKETEMPEADALIIFNCAGRLISLGPLINKEIEGVKGIWNVPMVGMFSNAELGRATNGNLEMHNLTTCCVVLKEK